MRGRETATTRSPLELTPTSAPVMARSGTPPTPGLDPEHELSPIEASVASLSTSSPLLRRGAGSPALRVTQARLY